MVISAFSQDYLKLMSYNVPNTKYTELTGLLKTKAADELRKWYLEGKIGKNGCVLRPIVINDDWEITLDVESRSHNFLVAIDGRSETCKEGTRLTIRKADFNIKVVKRPNHIFFHTLRDKMMWGADGRG